LFAVGKRRALGLRLSLSISQILDERHRIQFKEVRTKMESNKHKAMSIVVLYTEGCSATPKVIDLIDKCINELGLDVVLKKILINSQEEADNRKFLGSPTVQVNSVDIDPSVRDVTDFGFM